jgi:N6-L-threonylcarbamoyladenine synthase
LRSKGDISVQEVATKYFNGGGHKNAAGGGVYASLQDVLNKLKKASLQTGINTICIAGGVSANSGLRKEVERLGKTLNWKVFIPPFEYCTDNAGMIAIAAHYKYLRQEFVKVDVVPSAS